MQPDLPDGDIVYLQLMDRIVSIAGDGLDDEERAQWHRELKASLAEADVSQTEDFAKVLGELRQHL